MEQNDIEFYKDWEKLKPLIKYQAKKMKIGDKVVRVGESDFRLRYKSGDIATITRIDAAGDFQVNKICPQNGYNLTWVHSNCAKLPESKKPDIASPPWKLEPEFKKGNYINLHVDDPCVPTFRIIEVK